MVDIKSVEERSKNMAAIKSKGTKPEIYFRKLLFAQGYRYRINVSHMIGCPDLFLSKYNTAIFIHGCFWHRHTNCKYAYTPKSREDFWETKFNANVKRDHIVREELQRHYVKCLVIWECAIKQMRRNPEVKNSVLLCVSDFLQSNELYKEIGGFE